MKIKYRKPTLIEQMTEAIETAKEPIDYFELTQKEFQSVIGYLDKTQSPGLDQSGEKRMYSFKGIPVKVANE